MRGAAARGHWLRANQMTVALGDEFLGFEFVLAVPEAAAIVADVAAAEACSGHNWPKDVPRVGYRSAQCAHTGSDEKSNFLRQSPSTSAQEIDV